jgi:hypothetical protein
MRRRHHASTIFLLILASIGVVFAVYVSLRDTQPPPTTGRLVGRTTRFPVAVEPAALPLVEQAILDADSTLLDGLIQEGKAFTVANNRKVEVQVVGSPGLEIRVLEGTQAGRTGWVMPQFVQLQAPAPSRP